MLERWNESRFSPKRIAIVVSAIAIGWFVTEWIEIPIWVYATISIVGTILIAWVALYVALPSVHFENEHLVWKRREARTIKIPVKDIVSIDDRRLLGSNAPQLRLRGRGGVEIIMDRDALDPRQIAGVLAKLRELRPDLVVPDLLNDGASGADST